MNTADPLSIDALGRRHPEWNVWLAVHRVLRGAVHDPSWADAVPAAPAVDGATEPLVTRARFAVDERAAGRFIDALLGAAGASALGTEHATTMLEAAVTHDTARLAALALTAGVDEALLAAVAPLAASPLLQACARAWQARVCPQWESAACPVCAAWAAVMEARGVERVYRLRCGRCGTDWPAQPVRCPFCGEDDHTKLASLVSDRTGDLRRVEACTVCRGYVKSVTTLTACPAADVALLDLATVDLDVAALEQGYARPARSPFALESRVIAKPRGGLRTLLGWRA